MRRALVLLSLAAAAAVGATATWFGWVVRLIDRAEQANGVDGGWA